MAVLAIDTISHLPVTSKGNRCVLTAICLHTSYVFMIPMKENSAENVVQAYLSGILANKEEVKQCLVATVQNLKTKFSMKHWINWELKDYSSTHFIQRKCKSGKCP